MHDFDVLLNFVRENQRVCVGFCLSKYNRFSLFTVANQYVSKSGKSILEWTIDCKMLNFLSSLIF